MLPDEDNTPDSDVDSLLAEFDTQSKAKPEKTEETPQPSFADRVLASKTNTDERFKRDKEIGDLKDFQKSATERFTQIDAERLEARDKADTDAAYNEARSALAEYAPHIPAGYAEHWLRTEAETDEALGAAWEKRHQSPEDAKWYRQRLDRAISKLVKHLRSLPDPQATADREALTAAVRDTNVKAPAPKPVNYKAMSDAEFQNEVHKKHGFLPSLR